jgi:hypothetical protein
MVGFPGRSRKRSSIPCVQYQKQIVRHGLRVLPPCGKKPVKGVSWKEDAASKPVSTESYGVACDTIAVLDADTREKAV